MKHLLLLILLFFSTPCLTQKLECGDLLKKYAIKPSKIEFIQCKTGTGQTILEANYKVLGKNSEEIEKLLIKEYGMGKLKFVGYGWESINGKNGYFENEELKAIHKNYSIEISMYGNAEKITKNGTSEIEFDRNKIDFSLTVKIVEI